MNTKNENIDFWIGRIFMLFFFLLVLSLSGNDINSRNESGSASIDQVADFGNSVILIEPAGVSNYDNSISECELHDLNIRDTKSGAWISNKTINHQFKSEELRFFSFKPKLLKLLLIPMEISSIEILPLNS